MKRRIIKKSEVLREGYIKGLKKAQKIINEMLSVADSEPSRAAINHWRDYILDWLDDCHESRKEWESDESEYEWLAQLLHDQVDDGFLTVKECDEAMSVLKYMVKKGEVAQ